MAKEITEVGGRHGRGTSPHLSGTSPAIVRESDRRLHEEIAAAQSYRGQAKAANTLRAYTRLQCIIGTQIYGSGEADIPTMTSDWVIADI